MSLCASGVPIQVTQDMKWKHLYNKLGLSSQITSASYSLKMAYKKHLFPFEEHQRTNNDKDGDTSADSNNNGIPSPTIKTQDQQSGDEDCGSMTSTKSDQEVDQGNGPPASHDDDSNSNTTQDVTDMDTTDNVNDRYDHDDNVKHLYHYLEGDFYVVCIITLHMELTWSLLSHVFVYCWAW